MRDAGSSGTRALWTADHDTGLRVLSFVQIGDQAHVATVRGPARHSPDVGIERADDLFDLAPRIRREVEDFDLVTGANGFSVERSWSRTMGQARRVREHRCEPRGICYVPGRRVGRGMRPRFTFPM